MLIRLFASVPPVNLLNPAISEQSRVLRIPRDPAVQIPSHVSKGGEDQDFRPGRLAGQHLAQPQQLLVVRRLDQVDQIEDASQRLQVGVERVVQTLQVVRVGRQPACFSRSAAFGCASISSCRDRGLGIVRSSSSSSSRAARS